MPTTIFTQYPGVNNSGDTNVSYRNVVPITGDAQGQVRVTFIASSNVGTSGAYTVDNASIGISSGTDSATTTTPVELLFSSAHGFNLTANGQTITSDWADLSGFTTANRLVVITDLSATGGGSGGFGDIEGGNFWTKAATDSYNVTAPAAFGDQGSYSDGIVLIEVQSAAVGVSLSPAATNRILSFFLPTVITPLHPAAGASNIVLSKFSPALLHTIAYLNPRVIDNGLEILLSEATHIHICSGQPVVYGDVAGMTLGSSNPGAGNCFTAIADATPNGRQIATTAVTGAAVGGNGTAVAWAITDQSAGRLLAVNNLATPLAVSSGGTFNLPSFKIVIPEVGTDVLVGDTGEIDVGMEEFALVNKIVVCSAQPTDYATANTLTLGTKDFGIGNAFGSIIDAGWCHKIVSVPVTDGDVTDDGTAAYWAVLDDANSRLVATGPLTPSTGVTTGQKFTLTDIAIDIPILALSLIAAPAVLEYFYYLGF